MAAPPAPQPETDGRAPAAERTERVQREIAELSFRRLSIRIGEGASAAAHNAANANDAWTAYRGELDQELGPDAFYRELERPDLGERYERHRRFMAEWFIGGGAAVALGLGLIFIEGEDLSNIAKVAPALAAIGLGGVGIGVGTFYYRHPQPISEDDARALADAYNQRLRRRLELPPAPRHALLRDVRLTPYVAGHDAGAILGAHF